MANDIGAGGLGGVWHQRRQ